MRVRLVGAHHPPRAFAEMRRLDVALDVPLRALFAEKTAVSGFVAAEGITTRRAASGALRRAELSLSLHLSFDSDDGAPWELEVSTGRELSVRSLTELRGEIRALGAGGERRVAVLRIDVLGVVAEARLYK